MMKTVKITLTLLLAALACGATAQETLPARDVLIKVLNRRGKPVSEVVVQSVQSGDLGATDKNGTYLFENLAPADEIRVFFSRDRQAVIPAQGLDSLVVIMRRQNRFDYAALQNNEQVNIGYGTVSRRDNTVAVNELNMEELLRETNSPTLIDALRGRIAGLNIGPEGDALIRGQRSFSASPEPLVIVDGMPWASLKEASEQLNVHDIKTVSVLKDGAMYGSRGAKNFGGDEKNTTFVPATAP